MPRFARVLMRAEEEDRSPAEVQRVVSFLSLLFRSWCVQIQFQIQRARLRIYAIRRDLLEPEPLVHLYRIRHFGWHRIEPHALVADLARRFDDRVRQRQSDALAAKSGTHIQALHLGNTFLEFVQRYATGSFGA